ncbi:MAG: hypothetical protein ACREJT_12765, partial [Myxococcota bacterium]
CASLDSSVDSFDAKANEQLLETAGFQVKAGDTPQRIEAINTLAPGKISRVGRGGTIWYVFADPYECRCLWVGNEEQYARYRRLEAEEELPEIEIVGFAAEPDWSLTMEPW